jgi:mannose-1-phosphate guanylyltransferase/mannose-6-phosphate isomerase
LYQRVVETVSKQFAIILCGGSGTRLWPLSRSQRPKQLLPLDGDITLLQQTAQRIVNHVSPSNLFVITNDEHRFEVMGQLSELFPEKKSNVLAEPHAKNTLPAIAWGVYEIWKKQSDAVIGVFPSDHAIENTDAFIKAWQTAEKAAEHGYLTLLGVSPTDSATGYGYIKPESMLKLADGRQPVFDVARFVEKPSKEMAVKYVREGYLWNSGMFVFKAEVFMNLLEQLQPDIYEQIISLSKENLSTVYAKLPSLSIDYGLAEKAEKVAVVPVDMTWSDLGSWEAIHQNQPKDNDGNAIRGSVIPMESQDNLLWTSHGLLATLGIKNLAVIQTADATLVCERSRTEDIKYLVSKVKETHPDLVVLHTTVHRPWGKYTVLEEGPNFKIKRIVVNVGARLSMQMHEHRSEHWVVVSGKAKITNGEDVKILEQNESSYIPKQHKHCLENAGDEPLQIIEVQCGDYVGEDDIIRFEDIYGRTTQ